MVLKLERFGQHIRNTWRRMEKISWIDHVRNEEVLLRVNEQRNILHDIRQRKANWIGHILRRNCLLKQVVEGNIKGDMEVTRTCFHTGQFHLRTCVCPLKCEGREHTCTLVSGTQYSAVEDFGNGTWS
jgi:hypothetical protein